MNRRTFTHSGLVQRGRRTELSAIYFKGGCWFSFRGTRFNPNTGEAEKQNETLILESLKELQTPLTLP